MSDYKSNFMEKLLYYVPIWDTYDPQAMSFAMSIGETAAVVLSGKYLMGIDFSMMDIMEIWAVFLAFEFLLQPLIRIALGYHNAPVVYADEANERINKAKQRHAHMTTAGPIEL